MKAIVGTILALCVTSPALAHEVDIKKAVVSVDGAEVLTWEGCNARMEGQTCIVRSVKTGKPMFSTHLLYTDGFYNLDLAFIDSREEMRVKVFPFDRLFENMYDLNVLTADGAIDPAALGTFKQMYDVTPKTQILLVTQ